MPRTGQMDRWWGERARGDTAKTVIRGRERGHPCLEQESRTRKKGTNSDDRAKPERGTPLPKTRVRTQEGREGEDTGGEGG